jgi:hypothetical protein
MEVLSNKIHCIPGVFFGEDRNALFLPEQRNTIRPRLRRGGKRTGLLSVLNSVCVQRARMGGGGGGINKTVTLLRRAFMGPPAFCETIRAIPFVSEFPGSGFLVCRPSQRYRQWPGTRF